MHLSEVERYRAEKEHKMTYPEPSKAEREAHEDRMNEYELNMERGQ